MSAARPATIFGARLAAGMAIATGIAQCGDWLLLRGQAWEVGVGTVLILVGVTALVALDVGDRMRGRR